MVSLQGFIAAIVVKMPYGTMLECLCHHETKNAYNDEVI